METALAVFVYKRPAHTAKLLDSLSRCRGLERVKIHIFCEGAKRYGERSLVGETRSVVDRFLENHEGIKIAHTRNRGLAASIVGGVNQLFEKFESAVVLEDDLVLNGNFIAYHLAALERYRSDESVLQISGSNFEHALSPSSACFFLPFISTWGWSTWKRAWSRFKPDEIRKNPPSISGEVRRAFDVGGAYPYSRMLEYALRGDNSSWGALWNWHVFNRQGLVLYPARSLIYNAGFDGSGVHCGRSSDDSWQADLGSLMENFDLSGWSFPSVAAVNERDLVRAREALLAARAKQRSAGSPAPAARFPFRGIRKFLFGDPAR